jgi:hypothetical protein
VSEGKSVEHSFQDPDIAALLAQAKQAIDRKQLKECMTLINRILNIDPYNQEVSELRAAVRLQLRQDLRKVRLYLSSSGQTYQEFLAEQARSMRQQRLYSRATETLQTILEIDPQQEEAKNLLSVVSSLQSASRPGSQRASKPAFPRASKPAAKSEPARPAFKGPTAATRNPIWLTLGLLMLAGAAGALWFWSSRSPAAQQTPASTPKVEEQASQNASDSVAPTPEQAAPLIPAATAPADPVPASAEAVSNAPNASASVESPVRRQPPAPARTGTIIFRSQVPAEVFLRNQYVGTAPMELQVPPGLLTFDVRYQGFHRAVSYAVAQNETTTATISFETPVDINANPWAEVFVEGDPSKKLGETPLSGMRVTVGSVLVFRHPDFSEKRYRVTGGEKSIQIAFP